MRGIKTPVLIAILMFGGWLPLKTCHAEPPVSAPTSPPASTATPTTTPAPAPASDHRLLAVGAGAIVGAVTFNMLTYPLSSVPFVTGVLAGTPVDIALGSRLLAALAAGGSALAAHYLYVQTADAPTTQIPNPTPPAQPDPLYPLVLATGALVGIAAVNVLTYGLGTLPLAVSIETAAPIISPAAAAASRIFVVTSGVFGAWIADALYSD
ncbi:hypothetical protein [Thiobaca trueperi]|uniref:Uncharacterized protein n=1 Tax=Thiobaca trueperi TaxID=127458 RepID=A0A4R3N7M8_9GAMM|nr:hypothetical protein [Thiobaca trueperi]TCT22899.1 hypothetical protein EDC35_102230 [Thiobaca trueperi]